MARTHPLINKSEWQNEDPDYIQSTEVYVSLATEEAVPNMEAVAKAMVEGLNDGSVSLPVDASAGKWSIDAPSRDNDPIILKWSAEGDEREEAESLYNALQGDGKEYTADGDPVLLYASPSLGIVVQVVDEEDRLACKEAGFTVFDFDIIPYPEDLSFNAEQYDADHGVYNAKIVSTYIRARVELMEAYSKVDLMTAKEDIAEALNHGLKDDQAVTDPQAFETLRSIGEGEWEAIRLPQYQDLLQLFLEGDHRDAIKKAMDALSKPFYMTGDGWQAIITLSPGSDSSSVSIEFDSTLD